MADTFKRVKKYKKDNVNGDALLSQWTSAQTVEMEDGIDLQTKIDEKAPIASPTLTGTPKAPTATAGTNTTQIATTAFVQSAVTTAKNDLLNGAGTAYDTLKELGELIDDNTDAIDALETVAGTKANASDLMSHTNNTTVHITSTERSNWNDANSKKHEHSNKSVLDGITSALITSWNSAVTHISDAVKHITSDERTLWNTVSNKVDKVSGKGLSTNDYTTTEKTKLSGIATGAEVNQNAFSNVKVGTTTVAADAKTDTLELVAGSNVTITPDATNDKITISSTDTKYTHSNSGVTAGTYRSVTVNAQGHVTAGSNPNYAGSSTNGGAATSALALVDYADTSSTIQIGYAGTGATTSNLSYIAGYLTGGKQIKDVSKDVLKSWLGYGTAANSSTTTSVTSGSTGLVTSGGVYTALQSYEKVTCIFRGHWYNSSTSTYNYMTLSLPSDITHSGTTGSNISGYGGTSTSSIYVQANLYVRIYGCCGSSGNAEVFCVIIPVSADKTIYTYNGTTTGGQSVTTFVNGRNSTAGFTLTVTYNQTQIQIRSSNGYLTIYEVCVF